MSYPSNMQAIKNGNAIIAECNSKIALLQQKLLQLDRAMITAKKQKNPKDIKDIKTIINHTKNDIKQLKKKARGQARLIEAINKEITKKFRGVK